MTPDGRIAPALFLMIVAVTIFITRWAARRTVSRHDFYTAHSSIRPFQNGMAIAGDFLSASTILGVTALFFSAGHDAFAYLVGSLVGWAIVLFVLGERLRNLGRYTFADACAARLEERPIRAFAAASTLVVCAVYMVAQLVGAGALIEVLFGVPYVAAVLVTGVLMSIYVLFGGMYATTWVQIIKAGLIILGGIVLAVLVLARFEFDFDRLLGAAVAVHPRGEAILAPGGLMKSVPESISFGLAISLGIAGLPHLLMRFFTVPDARAAQQSIAYGMTIIGLFFLLVPIFGYGAIALIGQDPTYVLPDGTLRGGNNMAAIHLSAAVGGPVLFGFMAAVVFSTILAVVCGLSLTAAATVSHDICARLIRRGALDERSELRIARGTVLVFGLITMLLAIAFRRENLTFMVVLAFSVAASANVPILLGALYWRGITTRAAVVAAWTGLLTAIALMILGPTVWVNVLGHPEPIFPLQYPTLVALPLTVIVMWAVSRLDRARSKTAPAEDFQLLCEIGPPPAPREVEAWTSATPRR